MAEAVCAICRGEKKEHMPGVTQHAYTETPGQLLTHTEQAKQSQSPQGPMVVKLPGAQTNEASAIGRLVEVMLDHKMITAEEALYIAGMGQKPKSEFADPARLM